MPESDRRQVPAWFARTARYGWGLIGIVGAAAAAVAGLGYLRELVLPLLLAGFFAVVFEPAVSWMADRRVPRSLGAVLVIVVIGLVLAAALTIVVIGVADQSDEIGERFDDARTEINDTIERSDLGAYVDDIRDSLDEAGAIGSEGIGTHLGSLLDSAAGFVSGVVLGSVLLFYLLKDGGAMIGSYLAGRRPGEREQNDRIFTQAARSIRGYFGSKSVLALAQGVFVWIVVAIMGVPLAGSVGVVNFIGAYIPYLGAFLGGAFAVLMAISEGGIGLALGALAVVLFTNLVLENLLEPKLLGSSLEMHPIVVLISTVVGGVVAGIVGLILAAPLTAIGINLFRELVASGFFDENGDPSGPELREPEDTDATRPASTSTGERASAD